MNQCIPTSNCSFIKADERRLKQIIINLLSNAIKFTQKGSITIRACEQEEDAIIEVEDTGLGIRKGDLAKLFTEFFTAEDHQAINPNGTGLGLYISRKLAWLMKGDIKVSSVYGKGTKFTVRFPLQTKLKEPPEEVEEVKEPIRRGETADLSTMSLGDKNYNGSTFEPLKKSETSNLDEGKLDIVIEESTLNCFKEEGKKLVLIVDDNLINLYILGKYLEKYSLSSVKAYNGIEAIEAVKYRSNNPFVIILMDIRMPKMNGVEVIVVIKKQATNHLKKMMLNNEIPYTPIVALSGDDMERIQIGREGFDDICIVMYHYILQKPVDAARFKRLVDEFVLDK